MAKRRGKGKAKPKAKLPHNKSAAEQEVASKSNEDPPLLIGKQSTKPSTSAENHSTSLRRKITEPVNEPSPSAQTKLDGGLELRKGPSRKRKQSIHESDNLHDQVPFKISRSCSEKPSTSTQELGNTQGGSGVDDALNSSHTPEIGSLKRNDTLIIKPSTSGITGRSYRVPSLSVSSSIAGPSTSAQPFTTPKELIRIASLKKGLSRQEIVSILPAAASLSDQTLSSLTRPSTSDPETRALIAKSMELMRRASLRQNTSDEAPEEEANVEEHIETPTKQIKLTMQNKASQLQKGESHSDKSSGPRSQSVKGSVSALRVNEAAFDQSQVPSVSFDNGVAAADKIDEDVQVVSEVHPDCDPVYIREQLLLVADDPQRVSTVTFDLFSATDLPTRADREVMNAREKKTQELQNMTFDMNSFFKCYPEPELFFETDQTRIKSKGYVDHAYVFLKNKFPAMAAAYIHKVYRKCHNYLTPAYLKLKQEYDAWLEKGTGWTAQHRKKYIQTERAVDIKFPDAPNEEFYHERLFINHRQEILDQIMAARKERIQRFEQAKLEGKVRACEICCTEDIIVDDMLSCQGGHFFCKECVKMSANEQMGQGRSTILCLESGCPESFQFSGLESILSTEQSAILLTRMQTAEVQEAEIEGVVSCPSCPYAVVMPTEYPTTALFCQRPGCKRITCRICKDADHIPMTCEEYKVDKAKKFNEFIENSLTDAIIRECGRCHLRFFKEEGCNFMTCSSCGTHMCYVCRQTIDGYSHFRDNDDCRRYLNVDLFHRAEFLEAYNHVGERFCQAHPEMGDMEVPDIYRLEINDDPPGPINR